MSCLGTRATGQALFQAVGMVIASTPHFITLLYALLARQCVAAEHGGELTPGGAQKFPLSQVSNVRNS